MVGYGISSACDFTFQTVVVGLFFHDRVVGLVAQRVCAVGRKEEMRRSVQSETVQLDLL